MLLLAFEKMEAATEAKCTIQSFEWPILDKVQKLKTCKLNVDEVNDEDFSISSAKDTSIWGLFFASEINVKSLPKNIPDIFPNLEAMQIYNCSVESVGENHFKGLSKLRFLSLGKNKIGDVPSDAFNGLFNLQYLSLSFNEIRSLANDTFAKLQHLKHLRLNDNQIQFLHPDIFKSLVNVKEIDLNNNKIQFLDKTILDVFRTNSTT